jgi:hypothetical protein
MFSPEEIAISIKIVSESGLTPKLLPAKQYERREMMQPVRIG